MCSLKAISFNSRISWLVLTTPAFVVATAVTWPRHALVALWPLRPAAEPQSGPIRYAVFRQSPLPAEPEPMNMAENCLDHHSVAGSAFESPWSASCRRHHQKRRRLPWNRSPTCLSCSSSHLGYVWCWACWPGRWRRGTHFWTGAGVVPGNASGSRPRCDVTARVAVLGADCCPRMPHGSAWSLTTAASVLLLISMVRSANNR